MLRYDYTDMGNQKLFLLDAYALIFRAYYALIRMPRLTQDGFNTSAVFGFVNTLEELLRKENPSHIAVCFDPPGPTFRHEELESYKGERDSTPEDIRLSIPIIKEIIEAYRIPIIEVSGYEADDVIGTMARMADVQGYTVYMMTPDKDFGQLVSEHVYQYKPSYRGQDFELRGEKEVCERYGIKRTGQVVDLLALMGDKIDSIPGCPGIGEKTAVRLISDFDSVENLLANTDRLKGAQRNKIEANADLIRLSKDLATIRTDVPVNISPDDLQRHSPDRERLFEIFRRLEFKTLLSRVAKRLDAEDGEISDKTGDQTLSAGMGETVKNVDESEENSSNSRISPMEIPVIVDVEDSARLDRARRKIDAAPMVAVRMLTQGENDVTAEWFGTFVYAPSGNDMPEVYFVPDNNVEAKAWLLDLLLRPDIVKVSSSAKRDYVVCAGGRFLSGDHSAPLANYADVTLMHYLLEPDLRHDLDRLVSTYLHLELPPEGGKVMGRNLFGESEISENIKSRCAAEAVACMQLWPVLDDLLEKEQLKTLYIDIELPLVRVLAEMELTGVRLDVTALNKAARTMEDDLQKIESDIYMLAGEQFNVGSPARVGEILFDKLALEPKAKKTKTGQYSTSDTVLEPLVGKHPIVALIRQHRQLKKLLNTYLTALPESINPATGRVHTNYNQTVTATGRISSSNPNLQNIPVRDEIGRDIRRAFIPDEGEVFLSADYSQIELRIVADMAKDEVMLGAFNNGEDIHRITAAKIYHADPKDVTPEQRRHAKTANFGILYGISAFGLAQRLNISRADAKMLIDGYNSTFPAVHQYMLSTLEQARTKGYVVTIMGRKRRQPDINSRNSVVRGYAERNAINAPIQGSAADIIKVAMIRIFSEMAERDLRSKMIMQVHDELNFSVVPDELEVMREMVVRHMEGAYKGNVRLEASCGIGPDWLAAH